MIYKVMVEQKHYEGDAWIPAPFSPFTSLSDPKMIAEQARAGIHYALMGGAVGIRITIEVAHN